MQNLGGTNKEYYGISEVSYCRSKMAVELSFNLRNLSCLHVFISLSGVDRPIP